MRNYYFILFSFFSLSLFSQQTVEDNFEGSGTITTWFGDNCGLDTGFLNPYKQGINNSNTVLQYSDVGGAHANVRFDVPANFDLSTHNTFTLKIYVATSDLTGSETNQISLKLQDGKIASPWTTQSEIIKTILLDQWQEVTFDFANDTYINLNGGSPAPITRTDFNRIVLQVNDENNTSHVTAYIDDFLYDGTINVPTPNPNPVFDQLVWSDDFDGSGPLDTNKWHHQVILPNGYPNGTSWYNNEIQHYTNRTDNSYRDNGILKIVGKKESFTDQGVNKQYTSARLNSKFAFTHGKVEIRAKMPFGVGTFPALWMLGQNINEPGGYWTNTHGNTNWPACGEVDIIEHWGENQDFVQSAMHTPSSFGGTVNKGGRAIVGASTQFHIYTLEWSSEKMVFSVDGIVHYTYNPSTKDSSTWPFTGPQYILMNFAILPNIAGNFTESVLEVDYVKVFQESALSTANFDQVNKIHLYPNPIEGNLTIKVNTEWSGNEVRVYSILGKEVKRFVLKKSETSYDFSTLKEGVYFMRFEADGKTYTKRVVKI
tara:strand:- start:14732 stop:16357 length:1626 start_codon:yes stop_codon:yes gene_type:complete